MCMPFGKAKLVPSTQLNDVSHMQEPRRLPISLQVIMYARLRVSSETASS